MEKKSETKFSKELISFFNNRIMGSVESEPIINSGYESGVLHTNYADHPRPTDRERILQTQIRSINLFFEPLNVLADSVIVATPALYLPTAVSPANLVHAGIYVPINYERGVIIEYGAYDYRREGDYEYQVHYFEGNSGLRFIEVNYQTLLNKLSRFTYVKNYPCHVQNVMTIQELYDMVKFKNWKRSKYNLLGQNCQEFVKWAVRILGATRVSNVSHTMSKFDFPAKILEALEENEGNPKIIYEKIPYFGTLYGIFFA